MSTVSSTVRQRTSTLLQRSNPSSTLSRTSLFPSVISGLTGTSLSSNRIFIRNFISVSEDGQTIRDHLPTKKGLYDPNLEKDSCGVG